MTSRRLLPLAGALLALLLPGSASAATALPTVTRTLTAAQTTAASCEAAASAGRGLASTSYTAPMSGYLNVRLAGSGDWDLLTRNGAGRAMRASQSFGGSELVQTWIAAGEKVVAEGCRHAGAGTTAAVRFELLDVKPPTLDQQKAALVRVDTDVAGQARLDALGLDVTESRSPTWADVIANGPRQLQQIKDFGAKYDVRQTDLGAYDNRTLVASARSARAASTASALPSGRDTYRTYEDIQTDLKQLVKDHPDLVRPVVIGKSYQGREISGVEIAKDVKGTDGRPTFFLMGVHHAREWPSAEIAMEYATLLAKGESDARVAKILANERVLIVPLVNPDGYVSSRNAPSANDTIVNGSGMDPTGDGTGQTGESVAPPGGVGAYRRKNSNNEDGSASTPCENSHGVDNNRNYGNLWGGPGASADFTSQSYHGQGPRSEPETQAVYNYARTHHVTTLISLHTIAGLVLRPPGLHDGGKAPDEKALKDLGDRMAAATNYTSEFSFQLYDTAGTTEDDTYAATGGYGYTIEIGPSGGLFHGPYDVNVVNQWTGDNDKAKGGLHEALLAAAETAMDPASHAAVTGVAPAGKVLHLHKDFTTVTSKYCLQGTDPAVSGTPASQCTSPVMDPIQLKDNVDFKTTVPADGRFDWQIGQSTRPFVNGGAEIDKVEDVKPPLQSFQGSPGAPNSTVDYPFTLPTDLGELDKVRVDLNITSTEDYDLELFLKQADGSLKSVGTSGNSPGENETISVEQPVKGGSYVARVKYFAGVSGQYTLDVTRVKVTPTFTTGSKEAYTLSCEDPGGTVLESYKFVIDRGQQVALRLGCGSGRSTDGAGNPLDTSLTCALPNTAPTIGCKDVPTGAATAPLTPAGKLKVKLRKKNLKRLLKRKGSRIIKVRCRLSSAGTCTVSARIGKALLGRGRTVLKRAGTKVVKVKLTKRGKARLRKGGRLRVVAVGRAPGLAPGRSRVTYRVRRRGHHAQN